ncbi:hypothetical protein LINPERHAP1_LOCUS14312 [Linum perenne]
MNGPTQKIHCTQTRRSSQACSLLKMIAAPRLLAGLIPVPVMGMVAKCTKNTANPIGRGAKICNLYTKKKIYQLGFLFLT